MSNIAQAKLPCPNDGCGSSDAFFLYDDGHGYCFSCRHYQPSDDEDANIERKQVVSRDLLFDFQYQDIDRGIQVETMKKFQYGISKYHGETSEGKRWSQWCQVANIYDLTGKVLVAQKLRFPDKQFMLLGDLKKAGLIGQHLWASGGKRLVITEGEIDMLSYAQVTGLGWEVCSVPNGAQAAPDAIRRSIEFIESFGEVVFLFDSDGAGREAAKECAELLTPGKAKIAELPLKDANEMLMANRVKELKSAVYNAKQFRPDGIISGREVLLAQLKTPTPRGVDYPFPGLNDLLHGLRKREVVTLTAGSGVGKSTMMKEIGYQLIKKSEQKVGTIFLEESFIKTAQSFVAIDNNLPWIQLAEEPGLISDDAWIQSYDDIVVPAEYYDSWGSTTVEDVMAKMRYLAIGCQCDFILFDHISMVVSGLDVDERKTLDMLMTEIRSFVENTDVGVIEIVHLKRTPGKTFNEGSQISLSDLRGSAGVEQISDVVIAQERDQQSEDDPDIHQLRVLKNRPVGKVGKAGKAKYHVDTGRLLPYDDDLETPGPEPTTAPSAGKVSWE